MSQVLVIPVLVLLVILKDVLSIENISFSQAHEVMLCEAQDVGLTVNVHIK